MERLCITVLSLTQIRLQTAAVVFGNMGWASNIPEWSVFTYINVRRCWLHSSNKLPAQHRMRKWSEATVWLLLPCKTALCPDTSVQALTCFCWSAHGMYVYIFKHSLGWPALYLSETAAVVGWKAGNESVHDDELFLLRWWWCLLAVKPMRLWLRQQG